MTEQELAAFKAKLVYQLDTTTNEEAQLISDMVDAAAGGGGGGYKSATVTIVNTATVDPSTIAAFFGPPKAVALDSDGLFDVESYQIDSTMGAVTFVMSGDSFVLEMDPLNNNDPPVATGAGVVSYSEESECYIVTVTGDCTITGAKDV